MKKFIIPGLFILLLSSLTAAAQWRHYRSYYPYRSYPVRGSVSVIARLPFGAIAVSLGNRHYHYYNGIYYRPHHYGYMIVEPPIGIIVPSLPIGCTHIFIGANSYYRYGNVFYVPCRNGYKVVEEPKETETSSASTDKKDPVEKAVSSEYEKVVLEGKTYYKKGDKYYKASVNKDGEIVYEEVGETGKSN